MNLLARLRALLRLSLLLAATAVAAAPFTHFVTRSGDKLMDGHDELRFISTNLPDALQIITATGFDRTSNVRLPDAYELRDAVLTVKQMGGQVLRTFSITAHNGASAVHCFDVSSNPVVPNEDSLRVIDRLLQLCNEEGIRVYFPLIAYSNANRGDPSTYGSDFWTVGSVANLKFKNMLTQLLSRTNVHTGVRYQDDKAILGWQSGNELVIGSDAARRAWLHDVAAHVKSLAPNHLFIDGRNNPADIHNVYDEFFADPNIDVVSYHTYHHLPARNTPAATLRAMRQYTQGQRPLIVSEIAMYTTEAALETFIAEQIANGTSGSNWWAHRFRNREGGFYRHSDNGSLFEDLNWPGFPDTAYYLPEIQKALNLQNLLATGAHQIQGLARPPLPVPEAPVLLPIPDVGHLSWEGPTGAQAYDIERATSADGPWTLIKSDHPDHLVIADSLFADDTAAGAATYYYRVIAKNTSGSSPPSNVIGPVTVASHWLIDDAFDLSRVHASTNVQIKKAYNHYNYTNDVALFVRSSTSAPGSVTYQVAGAMKSFVAHLHQSTTDPTFSASTDGAAFTPITPVLTAYGSRKLFSAALPDGSDYHYLRIQLNSPSTAEAIGRVEIESDTGAAITRAPAFSPLPGSYRVTQAVTLTSATPGATIRYTTDGSTPSSTTGRLYTGPPVVGTDTTVKAIAFSPGLPDSAVVTAAYTFEARPPASVSWEAESLSRTSSGATTSIESDPPASNGQWVKLNGSAAGQHLEFTTPELAAGTYEIHYRFKTASSRGQHQVSIDGTDLGSPLDEYAPGASVYHTIALGTRSFATAGAHTIRLTVTGKNSASSGHLLGADRFTFTVATPVFTASPAHQSATAGSAVTLTAATADTANFAWSRNGRPIDGAASSALTLTALQPESAGLYSAVATNAHGSTRAGPAIVGLTATAKTTGAAQELQPTDILHPNGNVFDQVLLTGAAAAIVADHALGQITRLSFIDLDGDIVQVEFSGPGTLTLVLHTPSGPARPAKYHQAIDYLKGHAGIIITGATEQTNVSVFSVGRATAINQALFKDGVAYDGIADLAFIAIASANGKFGGLRTSNANYFASEGFTGVYAPDVVFEGPVFVGDITAFDAARPVLVVGSTSDARITGGDLLQDNKAPVRIGGIAHLAFTAGTDSHGHPLDAQTNHAQLLENGHDITASVIAP